MTTKKLNELTIAELKDYYELAQARFEQIVKLCRINMNDQTYGPDSRKFNQFKFIVDSLIAEIERRLIEDIDLSNK